MGRLSKKTLDFLLHDSNARSDRKIKALRRRHGNDGYATYFILLEMLCQEDGMKLELSSSLDIETVLEETLLRDEPHLYSILQTCVDVKLFDKQLWEGERIVFSHGLFNRYQSRLTIRKKDAERQKRKREADALKKRIAEVEAFKPEPDQEIRDQRKRERSEGHKRRSCDNEFVTRDNAVTNSSISLERLSWGDFGYIGGNQFLEERSWILEWSPPNPKYIPEFLEYLLTTVGQNAYFKGNATIVEMKKWLHVANSFSEKSDARLANASAEWSGFLASQEARSEAEIDRTSMKAGRSVADDLMRARHE